LKTDCSITDLALARRCAVASAQAYSAASIQSALAHVLVQRNVDEPTIIAFRGSASTRDWLTDLRIGFVDVGLGRVHRGFWESTASVMEAVHRLDQRESRGPVIVTGHSKGAAEAMICAWLLARCGWPVKGVVTFGGPRVGDAAWRRNYNELLGDVTQRWVHEEDGVARLALWITGYRHAGRQYYLSALEGLRINPPLWFQCLSDCFGIYRDYRMGKLAVVLDHPLGGYLDDIDQEIKQREIYNENQMEEEA
jgi:predicted lipase